METVTAALGTVFRTNDYVAVASLLGLGAVAGVSILGTVFGASSNVTNRNHGLSSHSPDSSSIVKGVKLLACPIAAAATAFTMAEHASEFCAAIPSLFTNYAGAAIAKVMPIRPKSFLEAYELGRIAEQVERLAASSDASVKGAIDALLAKASEISKRTVTTEDLAGLAKQLALMADERSITDRVLQSFSIVNVVWFGSILVMMVTVAPFLWFFSKPIRRILISIWDGIIYPTLIALKPVYEPLAYVASLFVLLESYRYALATSDPFQMTGTMTAVTGIFMFMGSWAYSTHLHATGGGDPETWLMITGMLAACAAGPAAVVHQSTLLGYLAVGGVLTTLQLSTAASVLWSATTLRAMNQITKLTSACLLLVMLNASTRLLNVPNKVLLPFTPAIAMLGTTGYFLSLNFLTAIAGGLYTIFNAMNLIAVAVAGVFLGLPAMTAVAQAWGVVGTLVLITSNPPRRGEVFFAWMFVVAAGIYAASLHLSRNPALLAALFSSTA